MAHEITSWLEEGCALTLEVDRLSSRETFSREINEMEGEGGGLNANYRTVEAIAKASSILGLVGFEYGKDFIFKRGGGDQFSLDFANKELYEEAQKVFLQEGVLA